MASSKIDKRDLERIILNIGDEFQIRIVWNEEVAAVTAAGIVAGALLGKAVSNENNSTMSTLTGAALGGLAGFGVAQAVSLRELWDKIKDI